jgi:hypothetical protein
VFYQKLRQHFVFTDALVSGLIILKREWDASVALMRTYRGQTSCVVLSAMQCSRFSPCLVAVRKRLLTLPCSLRLLGRRCGWPRIATAKACSCVASPGARASTMRLA